MRHLSLVILPMLAVHSTGFSMRDVGITSDINRVASSLNDIFKESFELMTGSLGKHGVYYLPEIKYEYNYRENPSKEVRPVKFHASNGWMKYPEIRAASNMSSGPLRKYKIPLAPTMKEILLVCAECLEVYAQAVNFCYEASFAGRNASGTITSGPVIYNLNLELRITKYLKNETNRQSQPSCTINVGERNFELSSRSKFRSEVRGLQTLNFLTDNIDIWLQEHFNTTVVHQLENKLLKSLDKVFAKHDVCDEFITH